VLVQKGSHDSRERIANRLSSGVAQIVPQKQVRAAKAAKKDPARLERVIHFQMFNPPP